MSYFSLKSSKVVSFWALRLQTSEPPAAEGFALRPLLSQAAEESAPGPALLKFLDPPLNFI